MLILMRRARARNGVTLISDDALQLPVIHHKIRHFFDAHELHPSRLLRGELANLVVTIEIAVPRGIQALTQNRPQIRRNDRFLVAKHAEETFCAHPPNSVRGISIIWSQTSVKREALAYQVWIGGASFIAAIFVTVPR